MLQHYAAAILLLRCLPSGNTHHTVWCSISWKSCTGDSHLMAFICKLHFNSSLHHNLLRILCWCQMSNTKHHSTVQNVLFYKLPRLNTQLKINHSQQLQQLSVLPSVKHLRTKVSYSFTVRWLLNATWTSACICIVK